jgi:hypothetical protein
VVVGHCLHQKSSRDSKQVCRHLLEVTELDYVQRFTGRACDYDLICGDCFHAPESIADQLVGVCDECFREIEHQRTWEGILGAPEVRIAPTGTLRFQHETIDVSALAGVSIIAMEPIDARNGCWLAYAESGELIEVDLGQRQAQVVTVVPPETVGFEGAFDKTKSASFPRAAKFTLRVSARGEFAGLARTYGSSAAIVELGTGRVTQTLKRDGYHSDVSAFPLAFADVEGGVRVIHGSAWNRLDVSDPRTSELLTSREPTGYRRGEPRPPHYLDYFHGQLTVSPDQAWLVDNGWVWAPVGVVATWSLRGWLHGNLWESEDGDSKRRLCWRDYYWDGPLCWVDDTRLAVWGYGRDDEWLVPAVQIFDVVSGERVGWFAGPKGRLVFDKYLFSTDSKDGTAVWDVGSGERLLVDHGVRPVTYHRGSKWFATLPEGGVIQMSWLA